MMDIEIKHYSGLNYTPAVLLAAEAQYSLLSENMSEPLISTFWDDEIILATIDNDSAGLILWKYSEWVKTVNIHIGYVRPKYRRFGVYRKMWYALIDKAREAKAKNIMGTTHIDNIGMRETARSLGRKEISVNLVYSLE